MRGGRHGENIVHKVLKDKWQGELCEAASQPKFIVCFRQERAQSNKSILKCGLAPTPEPWLETHGICTTHG